MTFDAAVRDLSEGGMFIAQLSDPRLATCDRFFLAFYTDEAVSRVHERLPMLAKVASWGDIHPLLSSATRGASSFSIVAPAT